MRRCGLDTVKKSSVCVINGMDCPICLDPCEADFLVTECCRKHFHTSCHAECMKVNRACPTCRAVIITVEVQPEVEVRSSRSICCRMSPCVLSIVLIVLIFGYMIYYMIDQCFSFNETPPVSQNSTNST